MTKKLYVGNLAHEIDDGELQEIFESHGSVSSAKVIVDRDTMRSRGFGFVEMASEQEAQSAIEALDGQEVKGRPLTVNIARPKENRSSSSRPSYNRDREARSGGGGRRY